MKYNKVMYQNDMLSIVGLDPLDQFFIFDLLMTMREIAMEKRLNRETVLGFLVTRVSFNLAAYLVIKHGEDIDRETAIVICVFVLMGTAARAQDVAVKKDNLGMNKLVRIWLYETSRLAREYKTGKDRANLVDEARKFEQVQLMLRPDTVQQYELVHKQAELGLQGIMENNRRDMDFTVKVNPAVEQKLAEESNDVRPSDI